MYVYGMTDIQLIQYCPRGTVNQFEMWLGESLFVLVLAKMLASTNTKTDSSNHISICLGSSLWYCLCIPYYVALLSHMIMYYSMFSHMFVTYNDILK